MPKHGACDEIKLIRDKAEAVRKYAQSALLGLDVQNRAAEVKLRAERQAGKLLGQLTLRGGDRRSKSHSDRLKLDDLGLTPNQSKRWQLEARVPENLFREHVEQTCEDGKELTSAGLMRLAKRLNGGIRVTMARMQTARMGSMGTRSVNVNGKSAAASGKWDNRLTISAAGDIVSELCNHHKVLVGILRRSTAAKLVLASGRSPDAAVSDGGNRRILVLAQITLKPDPSGCICHTDRARHCLAEEI